MKETILIVDDDPKVLSGIHRMFRERYNVFTANSGSEGLQVLENEMDVQVIIADYRMPVMNGAAFLCKAREVSPESWQILLTGYLEEDVAIETVNRGRLGSILTKPCSEQTMEEAIEKGLREYRFRNRPWEELQETKVDLHRAEVENQNMALGSIEALFLAVKKRDNYTADHQTRVAELVREIGLEMGIEKQTLIGMVEAARVHDVGKLFIPSEILNSSGKLNELEYKIIQSHVREGEELLQSIEFPWPLAPLVGQHHERLDGSGYPRGLQGEEIEFGARVLAVADVVEAMASHRPYRPAVGLDKALEEIQEKKNSHFDEQVVMTTVQVFQRGFTFSNDV